MPISKKIQEFRRKAAFEKAKREQLKRAERVALFEARKKEAIRVAQAKAKMEANAKIRRAKEGGFLTRVSKNIQAANRAPRRKKARRRNAFDGIF